MDFLHRHWNILTIGSLLVYTWQQKGSVVHEYISSHKNKHERSPYMLAKTAEDKLKELMEGLRDKSSWKEMYQFLLKFLRQDCPSTLQ